MLLRRMQPNAGCFAGPGLVACPRSIEEECIRGSTERCAEAARIYILQCALGSLQRLVTARAAAARLCSYKGLLHTASELCRKDNTEAPACRHAASVSAAHATQRSNPTLKFAIGTQTDGKSCTPTSLCNKAVPSTAPCNDRVDSPKAESHSSQSAEPGKALPESQVSCACATPSFVRQKNYGSKISSEAIGSEKPEGATQSSNTKTNVSKGITCNVDRVNLYEYASIATSPLKQFLPASSMR